MRGLIPGLFVLLVLAVIAWRQQGAQATHDGSGGHIDQVAIDVGPPGVAQGVTDNGLPTTGDRDGDTIVDAEGYDTPDAGDAPGVCGNGLDEDLRDSDGDTVPDTADSVADDGCVVPLSALETCIEIIDNDVLDADEDVLAGVQDRATIDIVVGAQPGPGGGIPASRRVTAFQYELQWDVDVLDIDVHSLHFLILAAGSGTPFTVIAPPLPATTSPFLAGVADGGSVSVIDAGPGVLAGMTIEGNAAGLANLAFNPSFQTSFYDKDNVRIPIDNLNGATVAVSKDLNGDTDLADTGERFTCAGSATPTPSPAPTPTPSMGVHNVKLLELSLPESVELVPGKPDTSGPDMVVKVKNAGDHTERVGVYAVFVPPAGPDNFGDCQPGGVRILAFVQLRPGATRTIRPDPQWLCDDAVDVDGTSWTTRVFADVHADDLHSCATFRDAFDGICAAALADDDDRDSNHMRTRSRPEVFIASSND